MNEKTSNNSSADETEGPLAGQRLAAARRSNDISISEIAKELHLDEPKVQALEENQFTALGAPVFAKGHLRKYAELVGVPIDDVLADYYKLNRAAGAPPVVGPKREQPRDISLGPWIIGIVIIAIVGGAAYWWFNREAPAPAIASPGQLEPFAAESVDDTPAESPIAEAVDTSTAADSAPAGQPEAAPDEPVADVADSIAAEPAGSVGPPANQVRLTMTFTGDCWTEVTDADGNRLFFGLGQAGQTVSRDGSPPLRALFGDRNNVSVTVNGRDFPLQSDGGRGNTARATIEAP